MGFVSKLSFVEKQNEHDDTYTFYFEQKGKSLFKAGQHGLFILPGLYKPHAYSLSSSPDEQYVAFTTHTATGSAHKKRLMELVEGDTVILAGPILNFTFIKRPVEYVFLAQGIGITPFRSMLKYDHDNKLGFDITLIHVDSSEHLFKDLTESYATKAYYPAHSDEFTTQVMQQNPSKMFYISGKPKFVLSTKKLLKNLGVKPSAIKTDAFYEFL
jgi:ferredoxin-NADP reductase